MNKNCIIGGLHISSYTSIDRAIESILFDGNIIPGFAVAVNAEKIVSSYENPKTKLILESASFLYPDGAGVSLLMSKRGFPSVRIPGCDLWIELMRKAAFFNIPVFIIGAKPNIHLETVNKLTNDFKVNIVGHCDGYFDDEDALIESVKISRTKIVTVALGSPRQELFINKCRLIYPDAFYMGVGGTYDVFTNRVIRAPKWFQKNHLEWFYRLLLEPTRISRQIKLLKYVFLVLLRKV